MKYHGISENELRWQLVLDYTTLPAAGAWETSEGFECANFDTVVFYLTYEEDAQATDGAVDVMFQVSPFSEAPATGVEWFDLTAYALGAIAAGADTESPIQANYIHFDPVSGDPEGFVFDIELGSAVVRIRVLARESGDTDNPGEFSARMVLG